MMRILDSGGGADDRNLGANCGEWFPRVASSGKQWRVVEAVEGENRGRNCGLSNCSGQFGMWEK